MVSSFFLGGVSGEREAGRAHQRAFTLSGPCLERKPQARRLFSLPRQLFPTVAFLLLSYQGTCCWDESKSPCSSQRKHREKATEKWEKTQDSASWLITSSKSKSQRHAVMVTGVEWGTAGPDWSEVRRPLVLCVLRPSPHNFALDSKGVSEHSCRQVEPSKCPGSSIYLWNTNWDFMVPLLHRLTHTSQLMESHL